MASFAIGCAQAFGCQNLRCRRCSSQTASTPSRITPEKLPVSKPVDARLSGPGAGPGGRSRDPGPQTVPPPSVMLALSVAIVLHCFRRDADAAREKIEAMSQIAHDGMPRFIPDAKLQMAYISALGSEDKQLGRA